MIKTVSFAPPRAVSGASSKPSSKVAARKATVQNASRAKASTAPAPVPLAPDAQGSVAASSLSRLFPASSAPAPISAAQARQQLGDAAPAAKTRSRTASDSPAPSKRAPRKAPLEPSLDLFSVEEVAEPEVAVAPPVEKPSAAPEPVGIKAAKKTRRTKIPVNLAEQYGQSLSKRVEVGAPVPPVEEETPRKRLNRAERAARRELMTPDDDLRARLHRAQNAVSVAKPEKRPRGWRFDCGRCGQTSYFQTPGAICNCGALALKE